MLDTIKRYLKVFFSVRLLPVLVVYILLFALLINRMFQKHARLKQHVKISMIVMESYWPIMHYRIT